jgi:tetratricopeptide (TPR) repeat protein
MRQFLTFAVLLLVGASSVSAGLISDCQRSSDWVLRFKACTAVIESSTSTPSEKAIALRSRGDARLRAGATDQAIADYTAALDLNSGDARSLSGRARARETKNDLDGAISDFTAALRLTEYTNARAALLIGRGHTLAVKGSIDQAIEDFDEAIRLYPESASAHNHRGLAYRKKGDNTRAIEDYTLAIALNPVYALAYNNRGYVYESLGRREEAIADFNRALLLDGSLTGAVDGLKRLKASGEHAEESEKLIAEGESVAESSCSFCHAVGLSGASPKPEAPQFRNLSDRYPALSLREPLSRGIAAPHDVMPNFSLTERQIDGLIAYINSLNR